jgi:hypothetical protein
MEEAVAEVLRRKQVRECYGEWLKPRAEIWRVANQSI